MLRTQFQLRIASLMRQSIVPVRIKSAMLAGLCSLLLQPASHLIADDAIEVKEEFTTRMFVADRDASNMKPLVDLPEYQAQGSPSWSPDGKLIAFDAWMPQKGESVPDSKVIVVNADGTSPRFFPDALMPSFSPIGRRMVVSRPKARGIWVIDLDKEAPDNFIEVDLRGWGADWSPDGKIVYATYGSTGANLKVVDVAEGRRLVFNEIKSPYAQIFWNMAWSWDGQRIAYKGSNRDGKLEFGIVNARGEKFGLLTRDTGNLLASFAWHPDGKEVLYVKNSEERGHFQIYSADPDSKDAPKILAGCDPDRSYADIAYSPDGKQILISCWKRTPAVKPPAKK